MTIELPARAFVFWPVGCGDSTTVKVNTNVFMQIDIHNPMDPDSEYHQVIDSLMDVLPLDKYGVRYLAVFVLTHAHLDHCKGFKKLMEKVADGELRIGELWFSPRIFRDAVDDDEDLSEDAQAFTDEALRRAKEVCQQGEDTPSGDRVRVIGNDDILGEDDYKDLPDRFKSRPGDTVTVLDGAHFDEEEFRVFLHAPFGDDSAAERNHTSVAMQITIGEGEARGRLMVFGDLEAASLRRIFDYSEDADVAWNVFLTPHHCSKYALFEKDDDGNHILDDDLVLRISDTQVTPGWIVASSSGDFTDEAGSNPPHTMTREQYEAIAPCSFLCTAEYPDPETDDPIVFAITEDGITEVSKDLIVSAEPSRNMTSARPFVAFATPKRRLVDSPRG
jgi:beta-lactamase superfamily II metal-dependent hydrolase